MIKTEIITANVMKIMKTNGNKNAANYGIAANQVLFPLGNDTANIIIIFIKQNLLTIYKHMSV